MPSRIWYWHFLHSRYNDCSIMTQATKIMWWNFCYYEWNAACHVLYWVLICENWVHGLKIHCALKKVRLCTVYLTYLEWGNSIIFLVSLGQVALVSAKTVTRYTGDMVSCVISQSWCSGCMLNLSGCEWCVSKYIVCAVHLLELSCDWTVILCIGFTDLDHN